MPSFEFEAASPRRDLHGENYWDYRARVDMENGTLSLDRITRLEAAVEALTQEVRRLAGPVTVGLQDMVAEYQGVDSDGPPDLTNTNTPGKAWLAAEVTCEGYERQASASGTSHWSSIPAEVVWEARKLLAEKYGIGNPYLTDEYALEALKMCERGALHPDADADGEPPPAPAVCKTCAVWRRLDASCCPDCGMAFVVSPPESWRDRAPLL